MADYEMSIESGPKPSLSYLMPPGSDLKGFEVYIPEITTDEDERVFKSEVLTVIRHNVCQRDDCPSPRLKLTITRDMIPRLVMSATIMCDATYCPLSGPGDSRDREPRQPLPEYPADSARLEEPQSIA